MSIDLMATLSRIEALLERIEESPSAARLEQLSMVQLALDLRQERNRSLPAQYFGNDAWDILLELYEAYKIDKKVKISKLGSEADVVPINSQRYVDMLMKDGFLYVEDGSADDAESYAVLTKRGLDQLEGMFSRFKTRLAAQLRILDAVQFQNILEENYFNKPKDLSDDCVE